MAVTSVALTVLKSYACAAPVSGPSTGPQPRVPASEPFVDAGHVEGLPFRLATNRGASFAADSRTFATQTSRDVVGLWDARTLKPLSRALEQPRIDAFSVTADGKSVFTTGNGEVRLWDVATGKPRAIVKAANERLHFFDGSRDGAHFLTISSTDMATMTVWRVAAQRPTEAHHHRYTRTLNSAQFDPTATYIVNREFAGPFHLLRVDTGREVCPPFETDHDPLSSAPCEAQFDATGRRLAIPLNQGFKILDSSSGKAVAEAHWQGELAAYDVRFSSDGSHLAVTTFNRRNLAHGPVYLFEAATAKLVLKFGSGILICQVSPGGRWALCSLTGTRRPELWDLQQGVRIHTYPSLSEGGNGALMSPDGRTILVGSGRNEVAVWRGPSVAPATQP